MDTRFRYAKWIGLLSGLLFGIALILVPAVIGRLLNPSDWAGEAHALGPRMGFLYGLLGTIAFSFVVGIFFSVIGFWWGRAREEAAEAERKRQTETVKKDALKSAGSAWPPAPRPPTDSSRSE